MMFRDCFKYYKSKKPPPNLDNVIDVDKIDPERVRRIQTETCKTQVTQYGLTPVQTWEIYEFPAINGLFLIRNPFTATGQRTWITKCLKDYSNPPNKLNIDAHKLLQPNETWWDTCTCGNKRGRALISKLRWATLGYHHNWDTKHYTEDSRTDIPADLAEISKTIAEAIGFNDFIAQAAIINYYRMNSTLAGHVDHSETNMAAPLLSISFGQTAIFLIGGLEAEDPAYAIFLRSGDVVIMSGESRLKYHGVPRILPAENSTWKDDNPRQDTLINKDWEKAQLLIPDIRINMNVRQVLKPGQVSLCNNF